jgi:hypothetical protein
MAHLHWPETADTARYSISQLEIRNRSPSMALSKKTYSNSTDARDPDETNDQTAKLLETVENTILSTADIEPIYDGLTALDETCLDEMVETDLVSSNY